MSLVILNPVLKGQYSMNTALLPYQDLAAPISVTGGSVWNEGSNFPIYFNFNFAISGQTYTALSVQAGGGLNFPGLGTKELFVYHTPFGGYLLKDKGVSSSISSIGYEISGNSGQHILKVQWKNAGFVQWYSTSDTADYVDFQIWLFEADNHIEIHFGNSSTDPGTYGYPVATSDPNPGPSIKFWFDQCSNFLGVTGPANLPSYWFYNSCTPNYTFIDGTPSIGITYFINPSQTSGLSDIGIKDLKIFPNPAQDFITLSGTGDFNAVDISIMDAYGQSYSPEKIYLENPDLLSVSVKNLAPGIYFIRLTGGDNKTTISKLVKEN